jgi:hypothetical protein
MDCRGSSALNYGHRPPPAMTIALFFFHSPQLFCVFSTGNHQIIKETMAVFILTDLFAQVGAFEIELEYFVVLFRIHRFLVFSYAMILGWVIQYCNNRLERKQYMK